MFSKFYSRLSLTPNSQVLLVIIHQTHSERLVAAGTLTECKAEGDKRVCDGAVTKELKSTVPSVQVCDMGKLKVKGAKQVGDGAPSSGGGEEKATLAVNADLN